MAEDKHGQTLKTGDHVALVYGGQTHYAAILSIQDTHAPSGEHVNLQLSILSVVPAHSGSVERIEYPVKISNKPAQQPKATEKTTPPKKPATGGK